MTATQPEYRLDDRYLRQNGTVLLTGVEALARLLVAKGIMTRAELMDMLKTIHDAYQIKQLDEDS